jgi:hypothetical protein
VGESPGPPVPRRHQMGPGNPRWASRSGRRRTVQGLGRGDRAEGSGGSGDHAPRARARGVSGWGCRAGRAHRRPVLRRDEAVSERAGQVPAGSSTSTPISVGFRGRFMGRLAGRGQKKTVCRYFIQGNGGGGGTRCLNGELQLNQRLARPSTCGIVPLHSIPAKMEAVAITLPDVAGHSEHPG